MKLLLEISITNACVNACPYCIAKGTKSTGFSRERNAEGAGIYLNPVQLLEFVTECQNRHPEGIVVAITGGEPMCHPAFECILDSLAFAKGKNKLALFSNLKLLTASRAEFINRCVDYLIVGYHPGQVTMCMYRKKDDPLNADDFGNYYYTDLDWLEEQTKKIKIPYAINYIVGAYTSDEKREMDAFNLADLELNGKAEEEYQKHLLDFELKALEKHSPYIKTPLNHRVGLKGCNIQLKQAPEILAVRPDGVIIKCAGDPEKLGSIYNVDYDWGVLCRKKCPLCPSFYPFLGMEHLFTEEK